MQANKSNEPGSLLFIRKQNKREAKSLHLLLICQTACKREASSAVQQEILILAISGYLSAFQILQAPSAAFPSQTQQRPPQSHSVLWTSTQCSGLLKAPCCTSALLTLSCMAEKRQHTEESPAGKMPHLHSTGLQNAKENADPAVYVGSVAAK